MATLCRLPISDNGKQAIPLNWQFPNRANCDKCYKNAFKDANCLYVSQFEKSEYKRVAQNNDNRVMVVVVTMAVPWCLDVLMKE